MFKSKLKIEKVMGTSTRWLLLEPLVYLDGGVTIKVPKGFETDLATGWIRGRHDEAAVIHDYLLVGGCGWKYANKIMNKCMIDLGCRTWHRKLIITAVRMYALLR